MRIILLYLFLFIAHCAMPQYNTAQINLEVIDNEEQNHELRISLFKYVDSYVVALKYRPEINFNDFKSLLKQDFDTSFAIDECKFNLLVDSIFQLSNLKIFNFALEKCNENCKYGIALELRISFYDNIVYKIPCFDDCIENENLHSIKLIVKKMFEFANIDYKKYFL